MTPIASRILATGLTGLVGRATLERLRALPANVVHGGHKSSFGHERMIEIVDDYMAGKRAPECPGKTT